MPEGKKHRLAGAVMLSFVDATREAFPSLQPPPQHAYLSNTAVDSALHRWAYPLHAAVGATIEPAICSFACAILPLHACVTDLLL